MPLGQARQHIVAIMMSTRIRFKRYYSGFGWRGNNFFAEPLERVIDIAG